MPPALRVSATSLWEIALKADLGKLTVPDDLPERIERAGLHWLSVTPQHVGIVHRGPKTAATGGTRHW